MNAETASPAVPTAPAEDDAPVLQVNEEFTTSENPLVYAPEYFESEEFSRRLTEHFNRSLRIVLGDRQ